MKLLNIFILLFVVISIPCLAEDQSDGFFTVYFADSKTKNFSIQGYDIEYKTAEQGEDFPIPIGKRLAVFEEGTEELPGNAHRKIIRIVDPETYQSKVFKTRVINDSASVRVLKTEELGRTIKVESYLESPENGVWTKHWLLQIDVKLYLEDGSYLTFTSRSVAEYSSTGKSSLIDLSKNLSFKEIDQVVILNFENISSPLNFQQKRFTLRLLNQGQNLGTFYAVGQLRKSVPILTNDTRLYKIDHVAPLYSRDTRALMKFMVGFKGLFGDYRFYPEDVKVVPNPKSHARLVDPKVLKFKRIAQVEFKGLRLLEGTETYLYVFVDPATGDEYTFTYAQP